MSRRVQTSRSCSQPLRVRRAIELRAAAAVDERRVLRRRRVRVQRLQRIHEHAGDVAPRLEHAQRARAHVGQRVDVVDAAAIAEPRLHAVPPAVIGAAEQHDVRATRVELREPHGLHDGFRARHVERDLVVARELLQALDVVAHDGMERPEHGTELLDAFRAGRDALLVEVVAEQVHAVRARDVVRPAPVEVAQLRAARLVDDGADAQALAHVVAELERHAVRVRELHVRQAARERVAELDRRRCARAELRGQAHERGAPFRGDLRRRAVAREELPLVVAVVRQERGEAPRQLA